VSLSKKTNPDSVFRIAKLIWRLALAHLVARVGTNHAQTAVAADDLAVFTAPLDGGSNFHVSVLFFL
jgi:hypothetical protein